MFGDLDEEEDKVLETNAFDFWCIIYEIYFSSIFLFSVFLRTHILLIRYDGNITCAGRIAIQSFCAPQCEYFDRVSANKDLV